MRVVCPSVASISPPPPCIGKSPLWMKWVKYVNLLVYGYRKYQCASYPSCRLNLTAPRASIDLFFRILFREDKLWKCAADSRFSTCSELDSDGYIRQSDIFDAYEVEFSEAWSVGVLLGAMLLFRVATYYNFTSHMKKRLLKDFKIKL